MSTVNATKVECDELTAKGGLGLPDNLISLTPFSFGSISNQILIDSINVSSVTASAAGIKVNFNNPASSNKYSLVAMRDGGPSASTYTVSYYNPGSGGAAEKNVRSFTLIPKIDTGLNLTAGDISFIVFDKVTRP